MKITILGAGYVGEALQLRCPDAAATRRRPAPESTHHRFDLDDPATWDTPPLSGRAVIWTFPARPLDQVQAFYQRCLTQSTSLIVLGSTSAYRIADEDSKRVVTVDEQSPLDLDQPRVQGEEWLRSQGATVLQLAGIFGPGRDPADWLRRGRIKDGAKVVNLVHVDDIVAVIAHLIASPAPGRRINVANGEPIAWRNLAEQFRRDHRIAADLWLQESIPGTHGKQVDATALKGLLPHHRFIKP